MANDFSLDTDCVLLWKLDDSALLVDTIGGNTLTNYQTVESETTLVKEGDGSAEFTESTENCLYITDSNLDSDVPFKSGGDVNMTLSCWFRLKSLPSVVGQDMTVISKFDWYSTPTRKLSWRIKVENSDDKIYFQTGYSSGTVYQDTSAFGTACAIDTWYHITVSVDEYERYRIRVWDDGASDFLDEDIRGTFSNTPTASVSSIMIGNFQIDTGYSPNNWLDGYVDEVVMFKRVLSLKEMDAIREQTFPAVLNDFIPENSCVANWRFEENIGITVDSQGGNTLTNSGCDFDVNHREGTTAADFESSSSERMYIEDANLDDKFPLKAGGSGVITFCCWIRPESFTANMDLMTKGDWNAGTRSMVVRLDSDQKMSMSIGHTGGTLWEDSSLHASTLTVSQWYHIAATLDADKNYRIRVWDDTAQAILGTDLTGTFTNAINIEASRFYLGAYHDNGTISSEYDGEMDEALIFNKALTITEIDAIRDQSFARSENSFPEDTSCVALWNFEDGSLTVDSIGENTLTDNNTVGSNTTDYKQGKSCAAFDDAATAEFFHITDANLDDGFPLKNNGSGVLTICLWFRIDDLYADRVFLTKGDHADNSRSFFLQVDSGTQKFACTTGYNSGASWNTDVQHASDIENDQWYHAGVTLDGNNECTIRIWDDTAGAILGVDKVATNTNAINLEAGRLEIGGYSESGQMDGDLDELVVFNRVLSADEIDAVREGTFTLLKNSFTDDANCVALWNMEQDAITVDSIGTNTLTNNSATSETSDYKQGNGSADFESSSTQFMNITDTNLNSNFPLKSGGTGIISVCFWVNMETTYNNNIFGKMNYTSGGRTFALEVDEGSFKLYLGIGYNSGNNANWYPYGTAFSTGVWYHVGVTLDADDNYRMRIWDDTAGALLDTDLTGILTNSMYLSTSDLYIGAAGDNGSETNYHDGLVDEIVVFNRVLTADEIDAIRTKTFARNNNDFSGDSHCVALWNFEYGALTTDSSGNSNTLTNDGIVSNTSYYKQGSGSADSEYADDDSLLIEDTNLSSNFPLKSGGTGIFSFCCWFRLESLGADGVLCSKGTSADNTICLVVKVDSGTSKVVMNTGYNGGASWNTEVSHASTLSTSVWYHLSVTLDGSSGYRIRIFDDNAGAILGVDKTGTFANAINIEASKFYINAYHSSPVIETFDGEIDEYVFFNRVLTTAEIDEIRAGTFIKYENDFSGDTNCVALYNFDYGALTTDSEGTNTLTNNATVVSNTSEYKQGDGSADFERSNSEYFSISDADLDSGFPLKSGDTDKIISLCFWVRFESLDTEPCNMFNKGLSTGGKRGFNLRTDLSTSKLLLETGYNNGDSWNTAVTYGTAFTTDIWYHIAVTLDDTDYRMRVWDDAAGALLDSDTTGSFANSINVEDSNLQIGRWQSNDYHDGEIDEIVVFNRIITADEIDEIRTGTFDYVTPVGGVPIFMSNYLRQMGS